MELAAGACRSGTRVTTGLVIGKFYPPHAGHRLLIDTAAREVDRLIVVVCDGSGQAIPAETRAEWIREMHPMVEVKVVPDAVPDDDSKGWADYTLSFLGFRPDAVFSSEDYGEVYARHLGARHRMVDRLRVQVPISATAVRADPLGAWGYLGAPVKGYYALRVAIVGAESTGKTTLADALAAHYGTTAVPEYGRRYSETHGKIAPNARWESEEFLHIAQEQQRTEDALARQCGGILVCDTDAFCTGIWHERYRGQPSSAVDAVGGDGRAALTLLCDVDIPFVQDGTRDGESIRPWMHGRFVEKLNAEQRRFVLLSGPPAERLARAVAAVDQVRKGYKGPLPRTSAR